jgi:hypothetical protein
MVKFNIKVLSPLATTVLLVSGCSSAPESKPEYDEVEVIIYQQCIDTYIPDQSYGGYTTREMIDFALTACQDLKPVKK